MRWKAAGRSPAGSRTGRLRISARAAMAARKLSALARKQKGRPTAAIKTPATDGPITDAALKTEELRAIALVRSSRPTISMTNAWRAGTSKSWIVPQASAARKTIQTWATRAEVMKERKKA